MNKYIDAEILKQRLYDERDVYNEYSDFDRLIIRGYNEVDDIIDDIPATDVMENVKGEWEAVEHAYFDTSYKCSICGEEFFLEVGTPKENEYNFCPNCGADMRGEK